MEIVRLHEQLAALNRRLFAASTEKQSKCMRFTEACSGSLAAGAKSVRDDAAFSPQLASRSPKGHSGLRSARLASSRARSRPRMASVLSGTCTVVRSPLRRNRKFHCTRESVLT
jgi:hypothetical protein